MDERRCAAVGASLLAVVLIGWQCVAGETVCSFY